MIVAGVLAACTYIQRLNVIGGNAPKGFFTLPAWNGIPNAEAAFPYQVSAVNTIIGSARHKLTDSTRAVSRCGTHNASTMGLETLARGLVSKQHRSDSQYDANCNKFSASEHAAM